MSFISKKYFDKFNILAFTTSRNGGCSQGDSGVVKLKKTKKSIISNQKG